MEQLSRETVVEALRRDLEGLDFVYGFWEGGAAAFNRVDEWSDFDFYLLVEDNRVGETFTAVEHSLESVSPILRTYEVLQPGWEGVAQRFYRLRDAGEYRLVDLAVLKESTPEKFLEPRIHGRVIVYFDKAGRLKIPVWDEGAFRKRMEGEVERLTARFEMFNPFVLKELRRRNFLEAFEFYNRVTLASLVEALRMKYNSVHYDFRMRYVHYELPANVVQRLERLYFLHGPEDLEESYREASEWFRDLLPNLHNRED